ncbi:hypothetical protein B0H13DRAFT_1031904 [Mycena leptocephala]|nr:hypothetical protein B0H13DRAFT_1031904 [Mycena leptocephala]
MKGGSGIEVRLYGIGATLWLSAFVDATLRLLACKMTDSDALAPSIILISIAWPHNSNPVHVASLEVLAYSFPARLLSRFMRSSTRRPWLKLRCYTPRSLSPRHASCRRLWLRSTWATRRGGSLVTVNPVGNAAGQELEHGTLDGLGVGGAGSRSLGAFALNVFDM